MKKLLARLFGRKEKAQPDPIRPGESWVSAGSDGSPWPLACATVVEIMDVRDGWVRYRMGLLFPDNRMRESLFRRIYRKQV